MDKKLLKLQKYLYYKRSQLEKEIPDNQDDRIAISIMIRLCTIGAEMFRIWRET